MEHGIIVIKPDGVMQNIIPLVQVKLQEYNLRIINSYTCKLSYGQAVDIFNSNAFNQDEFYAYLSSGPIEIWLVKGDFAIFKLQKIKYEIRKNFLCEKEMKNLLHTSDTGNEYKFQFNKLFPDLLYDDYPLYADLHISFERFVKIYKKLNTLSRIGIIIEQSQLKNAYVLDSRFPKDSLIGIKIGCTYQGKKLSLIGYFLSKDEWIYKARSLTNSKSVQDISHSIIDAGGVCIADYVPYSYFDHSFVMRLKEYGVKGFKVFDLRYSINQIERVRYFVQYKYKMLYTGGSNSFDCMPLTIDKIIYQKLVSEIKNE